MNGREFGCASHRDGGKSVCTNSVRVPIDLAERKLLERKVREHIRNRSKVPAVPPKVQVAKKQAEIEQLRGLMKSGTLSQAVAQAAITRVGINRDVLLQAAASAAGCRKW